MLQLCQATSPDSVARKLDFLTECNNSSQPPSHEVPCESSAQAKPDVKTHQGTDGVTLPEWGHPGPLTSNESHMSLSTAAKANLETHQSTCGAISQCDAIGQDGTPVPSSVRGFSSMPNAYQAVLW